MTKFQPVKRKMNKNKTPKTPPTRCQVIQGAGSWVKEKYFGVAHGGHKLENIEDEGWVGSFGFPGSNSVLGLD